MDLVTAVYRASQSFPASEQYGLSNQIRRAAVSVPSNIAEGYGRGTSQDYLRFLRMARASLFEVETQLLIAANLGIMAQPRYTELEASTAEAGRVLAGLIKSIEARVTNP
jgi:four helix bundle protein